jgi:hypothetical protein
MRYYKIIDFKVGDFIYKFKEDQWLRYGKVVLEQDDIFGVTSSNFKGVMMLRKDLLYSEGFIASNYELDNKQED